MENEIATLWKRSSLALIDCLYTIKIKLKIICNYDAAWPIACALRAIDAKFNFDGAPANRPLCIGGIDRIRCVAQNIAQFI